MDRPLVKNNQSSNSYSTNDGKNNKLVEVSLEIEKVKTVMHQNINDVIKRGENLDELQDKASDLADNAHVFKKHASSLRRKLCVDNAKTTAIIVLIVLLFIGALIGIIYAASPKK